MKISEDMHELTKDVVKMTILMGNMHALDGQQKKRLIKSL
tara:strand:+ start:9279 stop:9398 length:120 start_codon:yes stop_codon:yes gene_type:complete